MTAKEMDNKPCSPSQQAPDAMDHVDPASAQIYLTDEFRMYGFKVLQCSKRYRHDWATCPFAHPSENGKRRDPRTHTGIACSAMKSSSKCPRGDACKFAHNAFEYWLHPARYRTHLCTDGANCKRKICFFAHSVAELREATQDCGILMQQPRAPPTNMAPQGLGAAGVMYRPPGDLVDMTSMLGGQGAGSGHSDASLLASLGLMAPPAMSPMTPATLLMQQRAQLQLPQHQMSMADEVASLLAALQVSRPHSPQDGSSPAPQGNMMSNAANAQLLGAFLGTPPDNSAEALLQQLTANYITSQLMSSNRSMSSSFAPSALGGPAMSQYGPAPGELPWGETQYALANDAGLMNGLVGGANAHPSAPHPQWLSPNTAQVAGMLGGGAQGAPTAADLQYLMQLGNNSTPGGEASLGALRYSLDLPRTSSNTIGAMAGSGLPAFWSVCPPAASAFSSTSRDQWQQLEGLRNAQSFSGMRLVH